MLIWYISIPKYIITYFIKFEKFCNLFQKIWKPFWKFWEFETFFWEFLKIVSFFLRIFQNFWKFPKKFYYYYITIINVSVLFLKNPYITYIRVLDITTLSPPPAPGGSRPPPGPPPADPAPTETPNFQFHFLLTKLL